MINDYGGHVTFVSFQSRKTDLSSEIEKDITNFIKSMAALDFGPTVLEFQDLVKDSVEMKSIKTCFTDNRPGYDWGQSFLKCHKLISKKGGQMQLARKNITSDPFVVYRYYKILGKEIEQLGIKDKPECVYNCDKTGFPRDPTKCQHIGPVGRNHLWNFFHTLLSFCWWVNLCDGSIKVHCFSLSLLFFQNIKWQPTVNTKYIYENVMNEYIYLSS